MRDRFISCLLCALFAAACGSSGTGATDDLSGSDTTPTDDTVTDTVMNDVPDTANDDPSMEGDTPTVENDQPATENDEPPVDADEAADTLPDADTAPDLCGNGVTDAGEACDGDTVDCTALNGTVYASGTALCAASCTHYDTTGCTYATVPTFSYSGGGDDYDDGLTLIQTTDGGLLGIGYSMSYVDTNYDPQNDTFVMSDSDLYLVRLDLTGSVVWTKHHGGPYQDAGNAVIAAHDGGYIVAGDTNVVVGTADQNGTTVDKVRGDAWAVKLDDNGDIVWEKRFGTVEDQESFATVAATADGGYIFAGSRSVTPAAEYGSSWTMSFDRMEIYLVKTDGKGDLVWEKTVSGPSAKLDYAEAILAHGGNYYIAGATRSFAVGMRDLYLAELDDTGAVVWQKNLPGTGDDFAQALTLYTDGAGDPAGLAIVGIDDYYYEIALGEFRGDIRLVRTDFDGNIAAEKTFSFDENGDDYCVDWGVSLVAGDNGALTLIAATHYDIWYQSVEKSDITLFRVENDDTLGWVRHFGDPGYYDYPGDLIATADGGFAFIGSTQSNTQQPQDDIFIVKTAADGTVE
ncbi:MAG TPA: hypothetical protein PLV42_10095 [bacterium]|nr:hypothetical protein [bacterium]